MPFELIHGSHRLGYFPGSSVVYERSSTKSLALHAISNCGRPGDYNWGLQYHRPQDKGKDVVVYVMEEDYSLEDVTILDDYIAVHDDH